MANLSRFSCLWALSVALLSSSWGPVSAVPSAQVGLDDRSYGLPPVWPPPQQISSKAGSTVSLHGDVTIVTGNVKDDPTINLVKEIVSSAGGKATISKKCTGHGSQIIIGTEKQNSAAADAAKALGGKAAKGLDADGYVLASGKYDKQPTVVLNGVDTRGTFYAAQTLRQLVNGNTVPGVKVRDWPLMPIRGSIEGFYGIPWSHQARLDHYVFYGKHKMNTYIYTPKGDSFLRAKWRDLYGKDDLTQLQELVDTANENHVDFTFALSPGLDLCYSSDEDFEATTKKFDQVRELGVSSFYIALDDIPLEFHCDSDKKKWPTQDKGNKWIADAQTFYLNRIQKDYIKANDLLALQTVPTNYSSSAPFPYKEEFGTKADKEIRIQWTGEGVFSPNVTDDSVQQADETYATDNLYFWDNFPVNDGMRERLFLNPLTGRDNDLYKYLLGFTSNPMIEPYASLIALANYGDYTWNGPAYDATASWEAALWELSGKKKKVHEALAAFADINQNWPYRTPEVHAPELTKDIEAFWEGRKGSYGGKGKGKALKDRLALLTTLPDVLPRMEMEQFAEDVAPWSTLAMQWATACQHLISMLDALDKGNQKKADKEYKAAQTWVKKTKAKTVDDQNDDGEAVPNSITPETGDGAFDMFLANATSIYKGE